MAPERMFEIFSNLKIMNILYIILKHVVWRFRIYNYFRGIFKFRENMSKNRFREISLSVHKIAKFGYFAKVRRAVPEPLESHFAKIAHKIAKSKYFSNI